MQYEVLDLGLVYYKNIISNPDRIIDLIENVEKRFLANEHGKSKTIVSSWKPWTYGDLNFCLQKFFPESKNVSENDPYSKEMRLIADSLYLPLQKALDHYSKILYPFAAKNIKSRENSIHLLKYASGGHLPAHSDQGISTRVLSSVIYLNDNYDGGEIEFVQSGIKIKPEAGSIIFFPSNFLYIHEVHEIVNGYRYSMPHWYHNSVHKVNSDGRE